MKGCLRGMMIVVAVLFALPAAAQEKTYTNEDFKFKLKYPQDWKMSEQKPKSSGMKLGSGLFKVDVGKFMMPKMAQACFAKKKCSPGKTKKGPEYHLMMNEIKPMKETSRGRDARTGGDRSRRGERDWAKMEKPECDIIARGRKTWAGKSTPFTTMRCPEKGRWRYTTMLSMQRTVRGEKNMYMMRCTLLTEEKNKAKSLPEYKTRLKPRCNRAIRSSRML